jgi:hypothetical protein
MNPEEMQMLMQQQQAGTPDPTMGEQTQVDPSSLPAELQQDMNQDPNEIPAEQFEGFDPATGEQLPPPDPVDALGTVILDYMDFASEIRKDLSLGAPVRSQIMVQMAQAINYLVPLLPKDDPQQEQDMQLKVAEFQMKQQEQEMSLQMKAQEHQQTLQFKQEEMALKQQEMRLKLQAQEQQNQQKIVQSQQQHQQRLQQQEQASQTKPANKEG